MARAATRQDSIKRENLKALLEKYGGCLTRSISWKTNIVIRGCIEVGPKKMSDANPKNLLIIDEDGLLSYLQSTNPTAKPPPPFKAELGFRKKNFQFPLLKDIVGNFGAIRHLITFWGKARAALWLRSTRAIPGQRGRLVRRFRMHFRIRNSIA
jgi:hypothetical protein